MGIGIRDDQVTLYKKEMYKVMFDSAEAPETQYDKLYKVVKNVTGAGDKQSQLLGAGDLKRHTAENEDIDYNSVTSGWDFLVKYHMFSDGLILTYEAVKDSIKVTNLLKELAGTWKDSVRNEKESLAARPFNQGGNLTGDWVFNGTHIGNTDSSGDLVYDSIPWFNLSGNLRTTKGGGTYYNSISGITLNVTNLQSVWTLMTATNNRTEIDRPSQNRPDTLLTQAGDDEIAAWEIMNTMGERQSKPGSATNTRNYWAGRLSPIAWDYLDDTSSPFYLLKRNTDKLQFHERQVPEIDMHQDPNNKSFKADIIMRMGIFIKDWHNVCRGGGTSS